MIGPDAWRYLALGRGEPVVRPFHLRWLLPKLCRESLRRWQGVRWISWALAAGGMVAVRPSLLGLAAAVLLLALPGVQGPPVCNPVGVDLPAMALGIWAWAALEHGWWPVAVALSVVAGSVKESAPVFAALWAWNPILLVGLVPVGIRALTARPGLDALTASNQTLRAVHDHPFASALTAHRSQWRDAWVMVAPWGVCLVALYDVPWQLVAVLAVAHLQLLVATDTVRLLHTAAGPAVALAAVSVIPSQWLPLALAVHVVWWRAPVRI